MATKFSNNIKASEITNYKVYLNRRNFMRGAALAVSAAATTILYRKLNPAPVELPKGQKIEAVTTQPADDLAKSGFTNKMVKRLGGKRWNRLHKLTYVAGVGGVLHYWMLVKSDTRIPLTFGFVLMVLLGYRLVMKYVPPNRATASLFPQS